MSKEEKLAQQVFWAAASKDARKDVEVPAKGWALRALLSTASIMIPQIGGLIKPATLTMV